MNSNSQLSIHKFNHSDTEFWTNIGSMFVDAKIINELGISITSNENCIWFVAVIDYSIVGFCCAEKRKDYYFFKHDFVLSEFRNKGIYSELFNKRIEHYSDCRIKSTCNKNSLKTYLKNGFKIENTIGKYFKVTKNYE